MERPRVSRPTVTEVRCKSALNKVRGMGFTWSLNPYRGCVHHCGYCYARTTHAFMGLDVGLDFAAQLFAKTNVVEVLRRELARKSWRREMVAIGTSTDPYQPLEGTYRLTRGCLETLAEAGTPANCTTKGPLVVRDADVLQSLARGPGAGVTMSLITLDDEVWRRLEPGTAPPAQRLRAVRTLAAAGVPVGIALAPVLPGITDSQAALESVVRAAAENGASWLWAGALHMEPAVRDYFLSSLAGHFPEAMAPYVRHYGPPGGPERGRYAPKLFVDALQRRVAELKDRYRLSEWRRPAPSATDAPVPPDAAASAAGASSTQLALPL
ncbi:MAG TPA: radical SAM protein [Chloroflexota bacterium]|nr:radical SAM protein [Chloroflexota bacterium]